MGRPWLPFYWSSSWIAGAVIVSTPQEISLLDVRKAINMFSRVNVEIVGMVQNMSYFENDGDKNNIFGKDV